MPIVHRVFALPVGLPCSPVPSIGEDNMASWVLLAPPFFKDYPEKIEELDKLLHDYQESESTVRQSNQDLK